MDPKPNFDPLRENITIDPAIINRKFGDLPPRVIAKLHIAFEDVTLDTTECFSLEHLKNMSEIGRRALDGLIDELHSREVAKDEEGAKATIQAIVNTLKASYAKK